MAENLQNPIFMDQPDGEWAKKTKEAPDDLQNFTFLHEMQRRQKIARSFPNFCGHV